MGGLSALFLPSPIESENLRPFSERPAPVRWK
jgi:hypothetical protein